MNNFTEKIFDGFENEIKLYYCGRRLKNLSHSFGPYDRDTYLIYYIKEGTALLKCNGKETEISAKGFFVNFPNSQNTYRCKDNVLWSIKWIVVDGVMIEKYLSHLGITRENPFIKLKNSREVELVFDEMYENFDKNTLASKINCVALTHKLFSLLAEKATAVSTENNYVANAIDLISTNFSNPDFNVSVLSEMLGLHYNYFSIIFKKETGLTPKKAISNYRMTNACKMLKFTNKSIKEVASDCGFADEFYFSRAFRKSYNKSPRQYRQHEEYLT